MPERVAAGPVAVDGRWLRCYRRQPSPRLRVVCFPHAGGSASFFHPWLADLPPDVELVAAKYPGREDRMPEPPVDGVPELADALTDALRRAADVPLALFGHSLGAAVAYEVAGRLERRGDAGGAALLAVSSFPGPQRVARGMLHQASDETLADEVRRLGGIHAVALEHPELRALVLPVLRSDYRLVETYQPGIDAPLSCPILACVGASDPIVAIDDVRAWARATRAAFELQVLPGGHFYLDRSRARVIADIVRCAGDRSERRPSLR